MIDSMHGGGATGTATGRTFEVDPWVHVVGGIVARHPRLWMRVGNIESRLLADDLAEIAIDRPIYIAGLARAGSTLLLEILNWHPDIATHRYRDYPMLYTPYLWNSFLDRTPLRREPPAERSHRDGIMITPDSPEAFEEVLWMSFFPHLHDPSLNAVLDPRARNKRFDAFYRDHIRKLLLVRGCRRYASKGNYNVTRLEYLLELFGNARFVVPIREPIWHIASLMKQHELFCAQQREHPRARAHLRRVGHFEFGLDRRPINAGDDGRVRQIVDCWRAGRAVEGWALYWSHVYGHLADRLQSDRRLRRVTLVVRYEDLCRDPRGSVARLLDHCRLHAPDGLLEHAERRIRFPRYYRPKFTPDELDTIERCTADTALRYGIGRNGADDDAPPVKRGRRERIRSRWTERSP